MQCWFDEVYARMMIATYGAFYDTEKSNAFEPRAFSAQSLKSVKKTAAAQVI